ncbi:MAG: carbohydrate ABC transporter permease [Planctomycetota bacterium]
MKPKANPLAVVLLFVYTAVSLIPVGWLVITSLQDPADVGVSPPKFIPGEQSTPGESEFRASLDAYDRLFAAETFWRAALSSLVIAAASTIVAVTVGTLAAYGSRRSSSRSGGGLGSFLLVRLLPPLALAVPLSVLFAYAGLTDSWIGLIVITSILNLPFSAWMMRAFLDRVPRSFEEVALIDGYPRGVIFRKIVLPEVKAGIVVTTLFCFVTAWNELAFARVLAGGETLTLPVYLSSFIGAANPVPWELFAAGSVVFLLPAVVLGLLIRRHLVTGFSLGAVRG